MSNYPIEQLKQANLSQSESDEEEEEEEEDDEEEEEEDEEEEEEEEEEAMVTNLVGDKSHYCMHPLTQRLQATGRQGKKGKRGVFHVAAPMASKRFWPYKKTSNQARMNKRFV